MNEIVPKENVEEVIKRTIAKDLNNEEFSAFLMIAKRTGLDPLIRQIHPVKRFDKKIGKDVMTIQTGIDGYRAIANRTGQYCPGEEPTFSYDKEGKLFSATAYIKKRTEDGTWHKVAATAFFSEYVQVFFDKPSGKFKPTPFWEKMGHNQLAKCAEALAIRKAFPSETGGVYTKEEMDQQENDNISIDVKSEIVQKPSSLKVINQERISSFDVNWIETSLKDFPTLKAKVDKTLKKKFIDSYQNIPIHIFQTMKSYIEGQLKNAHS